VRVLITGASSKLGAAIVARLSEAHDVRAIDFDCRSQQRPYGVGDPRDRSVAAQATEDRDAIIHIPLAMGPAAAALDVLDVATRATYNLLTTATKATRMILVSTLRHFERYPANWRVTERWAPRPTTALEDLAPYLAELTMRETTRVLPLKAIALRLGEVVGDDVVRTKGSDARWIHVDDAVHAVELALAFEPQGNSPQTGWWVFHIPGGGVNTRFPLAEAGRPSFGYAPQHDLTVGAPLPRVPEESARPHPPDGAPPRHVVIYGAGGPLAAAASEVLADQHVLRLTDIRPLADIVAENKPRQSGAPLPRSLDPPHETRVVDVSDPDQVMEAARGMDAIVNCTAMRTHPVQAFSVNTLGAFNVMRAAVAHGIRRIVHTGPTQLFLPGPAGFEYDFDLSADIPRRPGTDLYYLSKFLGQEICRVFAEEHDLEIPCLLFGTFLDPAGTPYEPHGAYPFAISWADAAEALRLALDVPSYPRPFEVLHVGTDLPHGKYSNEKAKRLLNWQPRDRLEAHWHRHPV
jgi:nucleoside-diphosphate-sugar epimerase